MVDRVGLQLGNYRLVRLLGRGGFAEVYLGEHIHLGTQAAIKVLYTYLTSEDVEQFRNEARIIALFEHPHIVRVFDFGIEDNTPFFVMSYAPGGTLRQRHPKGTLVPLATVISYINQIAPALQYAHFRKHIHRDIKPENILIGPNHNLVLSDFGISIAAHHLHSLTPQAIMGTPYYMAPEQSQGQALPESDQYSLGIMVYEWLSGIRPFGGSSPVDIAIKHLSSPPSSICDRVPSISPEIERIVMKALAKNPVHRFASVSAFASELKHAYLKEQSSPRQFPGNMLFRAQEAQVETIAAAIVKIPPGTLVSTYQIPQGTTYAFSWLSQKPCVAFGDDTGTIEVWDIARSKQISTSSLHKTTVKALSWSPTGTSIASFAPDEKIVQVWATDTGSVIARYTNAASPLAWSNDGTRIAFCSFDNADNTNVQIWHVGSASQSLTIAAHKWVHALVWSPGNAYIASLGFDEGEGNLQLRHYARDESTWTLRVWNASNSNFISTCILHYPPFPYKAGEALTWILRTKNIMWSPDSTYLTSHIQYRYKGRIVIGHDTNYSPRQAQIWQVATGNNFKKRRDVQAMAWSPDSASIAFAHYDGTVELWNLATKSATRIYKGHLDTDSAEKERVESLDFEDLDIMPFDYDAGVTAVAWSSDGLHIASASARGAIEIWDVATESQILTCKGQSGRITEIVWSPDKTSIACINQDNVVQVWQVA